MKPKLSVVIPAYNEEERFKKTLPQILTFFSAKKYAKEIIIVDDGSTDGTVSLVQEFMKQSKSLSLVKQPRNQGKGAALRAGFKASQGKYVLFMDADLSTPLKELDKFWEYVEDYQVVIGSRKMAGAKVTQHQSFLRENLGKVFTFLTNVLATQDISDVTCGFKLFEGKVGRKLFRKSRVDDWSYDAEVLFLAKKYGYKIKEVPVTWKDDPRTKVNMLKDGLNAFISLFKIRLNDLQGLY